MPLLPYPAQKENNPPGLLTPRFQGPGCGEDAKLARAPCELDTHLATRNRGGSTAGFVERVRMPGCTAEPGCACMGSEIQNQLPDLPELRREL